MLIVALNPCPCGYRNDPRRDCHCTVPQVERYMAKISGPLLDRIDLHLEVPGVPFRELSSTTPGTSSAQMRAAVVSARAIQRERFQKTRIRYNAQMGPRQIRTFCPVDAEGMNLLKASMTELGLSALRTTRSCESRARLPTWTIPSGSAAHLSEAINYRMLDRSFWT